MSLREAAQSIWTAGQSTVEGSFRTPPTLCSQCLSGSHQDAGSAACAAGHTGGEQLWSIVYVV